MAIIGLSTLLLAACDDDSETLPPSDFQMREESRRTAEEFVRNSPTFQFDGIDESLTQINAAEPAGIESWKFRYRFESTHPGYGDRTHEESLKEQTTYHEVEVTISEGEVTRAVIDDEWDMLDQEGKDDWGWREAGEQALYGIISVFAILVLLTLLTRLSGHIITRIESKNNTNGASEQQQ